MTERREPNQFRRFTDRIRKEALEFAGIGLFRCSANGMILQMDEQCVRILGLNEAGVTAAQAAGRPLTDILPLSSELERLFRIVREQVPLHDAQVAFTTPRGGARWAMVDAFPALDERTGEGAIQVVLRDITLRKRAEEAMRESEERLRITLESIGDAVIVTDREGRVARMNPVAVSLTGWSAAEANGQPLPDVFRIVNARTRKPVEDPVGVVLRCNAVSGLANHTLLIARDGAERQIADSAAPIRSPEGGILGVVMVFRDVTEKYAAEEAMRRQQEMLQLVLDNIPQFVFWKDTQSVYVGCNRNFARAAGIESPEEIVGKTDYDLAWRPEETEFYRTCDRRVMDSNTPELHIIEPQRQADGRMAWLDTNKVPLHDAEGRVIGILGAYEDITERREAEEELRQTHAELEQRVADRTRELRKAHETLEDHYAFQSTLAAIRGVPADAGEEDLWQAFLSALTGHYSILMAWFGRYEDGIIRPAVWAGVEDRYLQGLELVIREPEHPDAQCAMSRAILDHRPFGYADLANDEGFRRWRPAALERGYAANLALPFQAEERIEGGVMLYAPAPHAFSPDRVERLALLAGELGAIIAERRRRARVEEALRRSEETYRLLVENMNDILYSIDAEGRLQYVSPQVRRYGLDPEKMVGQTFLPFIHPDDRAELEASFIETITTGREFPSRFRFATPTGGFEWFEEVGRVRRDATGRIVGINGVARNITEQHDAEEALRESEEKHRTLVESASLGIGIVQDGRIVYVNPRIRALIGRSEEELLGRSFLPVVHPDEAIHVQSRYERHRAGIEETQCYETALRDRAGQRVDIELSVCLIPYNGRTASLVFVQDIRQRKQAEQALIRAERLAAVGTLAGGVAHEFNNINVSILGFAQLALERTDLDMELREWLERILNAARRAGSITKNLLTFARPHETSFAREDLVQVVEDTIHLVQREFETDGIELVRDCTPVPELVMNAAQVGQVVLNFLINARHALMDRPQRRIEVRTGFEGARAFVSVRDSGCGISREDMDRIFTPFFTTKGEYARGESAQARVRGTGLGLSISHTIASEHGGEITVESRPGEGSVFTLWLPLRGRCPTSDGAETPGGAGGGDGGAAAGRVLILDDEPDTCDLLRLFLEREGFGVVTTQDGAEALSRFAREPFDLVLVDLQMPAMDGLEFLQRLERLPASKRPRPLVMTGKSIPWESLQSLGVLDVVHKPFELEALLAVIREILSGSR